jgi:hypothetical protein
LSENPWGSPGKNKNKKNFDQNVSSYTSIDVFFDGDYEFDIIGSENSKQKPQNRKTRARFGLKMLKNGKYKK